MMPVSTQEILNLTEEQIRDLTKQERWQLISALEMATDKLQQTMVKLKNEKIAYSLMQQDHARIRAKVVIIWFSFYPRLSPYVRFANQLAA